jgi:cullin-associated NEDD8-dissociated protein 1
LYSSRRQAIRKRAISCIGYITVCLDSQRLEKLIGYTIYQTTLKLDTDSKKTLTALFSQIIPTTCSNLLISSDKSPLEDSINSILSFILDNLTEADDELSELSLYALNALCTVFPKRLSIESYRFADICTYWMKYDPNYNFEKDDDSFTKQEPDEQMLDIHYEVDSESVISEADISDEDDNSWKVRKAAVNLAITLVNCYGTIEEPLLFQLSRSMYIQCTDRVSLVLIDVLKSLKYTV